MYSNLLNIQKTKNLKQMKIEQNHILDTNKSGLQSHKENFDFLANNLSKKGANVEAIVSKIKDFQVAIPPAPKAQLGIAT